MNETPYVEHSLKHIRLPLDVVGMPQEVIGSPSQYEWVSRSGRKVSKSLIPDSQFPGTLTPTFTYEYWFFAV